MKFVLLLALGLLVFGPLAESGRILRTWRRRSISPGRRSPFQAPSPIRRSHYSSPWQFFGRPSTIYPQSPQLQPMTKTRKNREDRSNHFRGFQRGRELNKFAHHGFPIQRDPTTHYAPPSEDEISVGSGPGQRSIGGQMRTFRPWRRPPPSFSHISLWKLLAMKQMRRFRPWRPFPPPPPPRSYSRPYSASEEAEITPHLPNIVYFLPKDTLPKVSTKSTTGSGKERNNQTDMKPGYVSDVPLYPTESTSPSEFKPVTSKNYLLKVVDVVRKPTLLEAASTVSTTTDSTQRSAPAPDLLDSTESLLHEVLLDPPSPINSFNINIDLNAEGSEDFIKVVPSSFVNTEKVTEEPTTTRRTTTVTMTRSTTSTTFKPMFAVRVIMPPVSESTTSPESPESISGTKNSEKTATGVNDSKEENVNSKEEKTKVSNGKEEISTVYNLKETKVGIHTLNETKSEKKIEKATVQDELERINQVPEVTKAPVRTAPAYKWPAMKPYQKSVTKKPYISSNPSKVSTVVKSSGTSTSSSESTSISITGVRSKVKEYKPSHLPTAPGLLVFDKVDTSAEIEQKSSTSTTSSTSSPPKETNEEVNSTSSTTTTISPMQNFDPMKMIHSWLTKTKPS